MTGCNPPTNDTTDSTATDGNYSIYTFSDGNNNNYTLTQTASGGTLNYDPVTPAESSSGVYSGGEPALKEITQEQYTTITEAIENAVTNTSDHMENRVKKSGQITIQRNTNDPNSQKEVYIIAPSTDSKKAIKGALHKVLDS